MFEKIDQLRIQLAKLYPLAEGLQRDLQERLRIEWTYNSNAIEGNTLTFGETAFFLREGLTSEGRPLKDYIEAENHAEAIDGLMEIIQGERKITEGLIKQLHALLLRGIEFTHAKGANGKLVKKPLTPGQYKKRPNHVLTLSGVIHHYTDPLHVKDEMEALIYWLNNAKKVHPVQKAALFHYRFVAIHPFDDGNGRLSRLLMNLILMQNGYPPCIIKNVNRRRYLKVIELADQKNYEPFIEFVAEELAATQQMMLDVINGKLIDHLYETRKNLNRDERHDRILNAIGEAPLSISQIEERVFIKRPTLKKDLQDLVRHKKIKRKGVGKGVLYYNSSKLYDPL